MQQPRPSVLVLMGGPDAEREVSLMSGTAVAEALRDGGRFDVIEAVIDRPVAEAIGRLGGDVVFPVLHGGWGEGGGVQAELETLGVPYVGSRPRAAALAMDKLATKTLARRLQIATPPARQLRAQDECDLSPPLVLKPVDDGSSVDLVICESQAEVEAARATLHIRRPRLMAERYIAGRELTVGIVLDTVLPLVEIIPAAGVYDYQAKYERDDTRYVVDPPLPPGVAEQCRRGARQLYDALPCRDLARIDFMLDDERAWLLEVNTMPGFTSHSLVPMAAAAAGTEMAKLCGDLVEAALSRRKAIV